MHFNFIKKKCPREIYKSKKFIMHLDRKNNKNMANKG